jgi:hypothetical protein
MSRLEWVKTKIHISRAVGEKIPQRNKGWFLHPLRSVSWSGSQAQYAHDLSAGTPPHSTLFHEGWCKPYMTVSWVPPFIGSWATNFSPLERDQ